MTWSFGPAPLQAWCEGVARDDQQLKATSGGKQGNLVPKVCPHTTFALFGLQLLHVDSAYAAQLQLKEKVPCHQKEPSCTMCDWSHLMTLAVCLCVFVHFYCCAWPGVFWIWPRGCSELPKAMTEQPACQGLRAFPACFVDALIGSMMIHDPSVES